MFSYSIAAHAAHTHINTYVYLQQWYVLITMTEFVYGILMKVVHLPAFVAYTNDALLTTIALDTTVDWSCLSRETRQWTDLLNERQRENKQRGRGGGGQSV